MKIPLKAYWNLLLDYLRPQWRSVLLLTVLLFSGIGLQLINPQIMRRFIDTATQPDSALSTLRNAALLFIGVALVQQVTSVVATYLSESVGWRATNGLRADLADHCLRLDMAFHNAHTPGEMIERLDGDVMSLSNFFSQFTIQVLGSALLMVGVLVFLYLENWRVGVAFTVFSAIALLIMARFRSIAVPHWEAARQASADMFGFLEERLAGTEDIRSCGAREYAMLRFYQLMRTVYQKELKAGLMVNVMVNSTMLSFAVGNAVAFGLGAFLYQRGLATIGAVYIVSYYSGMLMMPIMRISRQLEDLQRAGAGIKRIQELFAVERKVIEDPAAGKRIGDGALAVQFDHVSFGYDDAGPPEATEGAPTADERAQAAQKTEPVTTATPGDDAREEPAPKQVVLHDLNFYLQPGTVLGLLGRTGSGKTTMTRLLFRLWDPDTGHVRLGAPAGPDEGFASSQAPGDPQQNGENGLVDIRQVTLDDLRGHIGMVTQNIQLFHATVRDNLTFFDRSIPDERVHHAIEALGLGEWLDSLSEGLDTELESGGSGLSAGEAQLLAFTRIFLQDPGLVILDEASSRLDPATENLIERAVERLTQNRTAIIIAHRLGTVERADEIMILEEGCIREYGARAALAADPDSRFYSLLQTGMEEVLV